ncbi:MAG: FAD:protein FMN transferase [Acidobacteriota bacterium]
MGTVLEIEAAGGLQGSSAEAALESAFAEVGRVEERLSNWRPESELSRANRSAGREAFPITRATAESLIAALALAGETGGAFDPTVGPITLERIPGLAKNSGGRDISKRVREVGYRRARVDVSAPTATLSFDSPGMSIDAGGFGKGEALDAAAAALRAAGVESARLNFGGQILVLGSLGRPGIAAVYGRAAVAAPDDSGRLVSRVVIPDGSLSTSGDSEQPGHIVDPRTGRAAAFHGSATVFASSGVRADALSTALFVMGPAAGIAFAEARQIPALYIDAAGRLSASRAWSELPSWTEPKSIAIAKRRTE